MEIKDVKVNDFSEENKMKLSKLPRVINTKGDFKTQVINYIKYLSGMNTPKRI